MEQNHLQQMSRGLYSLSAGYILKLFQNIFFFRAGLNEKKSSVISDLTNFSLRLEKRLLTICAGLSHCSLAML